MAHVKFRLVEEGDYDNKWLSQQLHNGDWPYWLLIELMFMDQHLSEQELKEFGKYNVTVSAVSPEAAGEEKLQKEALSQYSWDLETYQNIVKDQQAKVLVTYELCCKAPLWQRSGNNWRELVKQAKKEALTIEGLFGFYMDRPVNAVGDTGWDWIKGDIGVAVQRRLAKTGKTFSVIEYSSFFAVRHNPTGEEHPMGDGVDALFDEQGKALRPGTDGFIEAWEGSLNATEEETLEAYFPHLLEKE